MKKILIMAALFISTYASTSAQDRNNGNSRPTQQQRAENQSERMQKMLDLTPQQKARVYEVNMEYLKKVEASHADKKIKIQDIRAERNNQLNTILTKEQQAKWQENNKNRMRGRHEDRKAKMREPQEQNKKFKDIEKSAQ